MMCTVDEAPVEKSATVRVVRLVDVQEPVKRRMTRKQLAIRRLVCGGGVSA